MRKPGRLNRQERRAKRKELAASYRVRLALAGKMTEQAKTNDLGLLRKYVKWAGV